MGFQAVSGPKVNCGRQVHYRLDQVNKMPNGDINNFFIKTNLIEGPTYR